MEEISVRKEQKISIDPDVVLGIGEFGSYIKGKFDGREIAVKKVPLQDHSFNQEEAMLKLEHPNILKLLHCYSDEHFRYYAFELCIASLDKLFLESNHLDKYNGPMPRHIEICHQLASGLEHIHSNNLVHGDIKPENALISVGSAGQDKEITIKWVHFGLTRNIGEQETSITSEVRGKYAWLAPELLKPSSTKGQSTAASDVFAQGLVFCCLFLNGEHLYGSTKNGNEIHVNIINRNPINMKKIDSKLRDRYEYDLLKKMLEDNPGNRISSADIVKQLKIIKKELTGDEDELVQQCSGGDRKRRRLDHTEEI
ncbi:serine/threonine-protein kinase/endoribonuclease IRE1-like [Daphnia carinata]|uniref:serine/threonine-protein kinase/endoribonuclease IRE1-like n=1 Tax=Daphnia carinata TaxID=120202 RepID=UPI002868B454|nr:serine/threonine-protein kinase/endoribonuclease IRE1-like [Daphnia carinata]